MTDAEKAEIRQIVREESINALLFFQRFEGLSRARGLPQDISKVIERDYFEIFGEALPNTFGRFHHLESEQPDHSAPDQRDTPE